MDMQGLIENGPINIVVLGDSVTHGALRGCQNYETVYWNLLKQKMNAMREPSSGGIGKRLKTARLAFRIQRFFKNVNQRNINFEPISSGIGNPELVKERFQKYAKE